jgi:integrase/recombinase XerD
LKYCVSISVMEKDIQAFLDYLGKNKGYTNNTLSSYRSDLIQLSGFVKSQNPAGTVEPGGSKLNTDVLSAYMRTLQEKRYSVSTIARKVAAAKTFLKFMVDTGRLRSDLTPNLASPQVSKPVPQPLSISEVRRFLLEPSKLNTTEAKRDKAMLELLYATGLRASELMALNTNDIDTKSGNVHCHHNNSVERVIPIDQVISKIIKDYIFESRVKLLSNQAESALFLNRRGERLTRQGFWQIVQGYADKVGLSNKVTPRSLRHSFAVHRLKNGADIQSVQQLLGHVHISTTKAYKDIRI